MAPAERLRAAYKAVDEVASGLVLGNDPASGFRIIAHAAINNMRHLSPGDTRLFLEEWTKTVVDDLGHSVAVGAR